MLGVNLLRKFQGKVCYFWCESPLRQYAIVTDKIAFPKNNIFSPLKKWRQKNPQRSLPFGIVRGYVLDLLKETVVAKKNDKHIQFPKRWFTMIESVKNHQLNKHISSSFRICRVLLYRVYIPGLGYVANLPMVKTTSYPPGRFLTT